MQKASFVVTLLAWKGDDKELWPWQKIGVDVTERKPELKTVQVKKSYYNFCRLKS